MLASSEPRLRPFEPIAPWDPPSDVDIEAMLSPRRASMRVPGPRTLAAFWAVTLVVAAGGAAYLQYLGPPSQASGNDPTTPRTAGQPPVSAEALGEAAGKPDPQPPLRLAEDPVPRTAPAQAATERQGSAMPDAGSAPLSVATIADDLPEEPQPAPQPIGMMAAPVAPPVLIPPLAASKDHPPAPPPSPGQSIPRLAASASGSTGPTSMDAPPAGVAAEALAETAAAVAPPPPPVRLLSDGLPESAGAFSGLRAIAMSAGPPRVAVPPGEMPSANARAGRPAGPAARVAAPSDPPVPAAPIAIAMLPATVAEPGDAHAGPDTIIPAPAMIAPLAAMREGPDGADPTPASAGWAPIHFLQRAFALRTHLPPEVNEARALQAATAPAEIAVQAAEAAPATAAEQSTDVPRAVEPAPASAAMPSQAAAAVQMAMSPQSEAPAVPEPRSTERPVAAQIQESAILPRASAPAVPVLSSTEHPVAAQAPQNAVLPQASAPANSPPSPAERAVAADAARPGPASPEMAPQTAAPAPRPAERPVATLSPLTIPAQSAVPPQTAASPAAAPPSIERPVTPAAQPAPAAPAATQAAAAAPARPAPPRSASLGPAMIAALLRRGEAMLAQGDISAARLLFERAALGGSGAGAIALGRSYDPRFLPELGARGLQPDAATAARWYERAADLGEAEAEQLRNGLPPAPRP